MKQLKGYFIDGICMNKIWTILFILVLIGVGYLYMPKVTPLKERNKQICLARIELLRFHIIKEIFKSDSSLDLKNLLEDLIKKEGAEIVVCPESKTQYLINPEFLIYFTAKKNSNRVKKSRDIIAILCSTPHLKKDGISFYYAITFSGESIKIKKFPTWADGTGGTLGTLQTY
ncbi:MAG: hypothetical protein Q7U02_13610 [Desulfosalsimonadaceae bacterium]|nr:hypothetical protein [Desulfosalsimonadaceae bacterium]